MPTTPVKPLSKKKQATLDHALYSIACHYKSKKQEQLNKALTPRPKPLPVRVNFTAEVYGFYVMQEWQAHLLDYPWSLPSQIRWKEDLDRIQQEQAQNFALALRDYMAVASFGEARYGVNLSDPEKTIRTSVKKYSSRTSCYHEAPKHSVIPLLQDLCRFFGGPKNFNGSTGGAPWKVACEYALTYQTVSDIQFVDTVIDLRHHSDHLFNKPCVFFESTHFEAFFHPHKAIKQKATGALWYLGNQPSPDLLLSSEVYTLAQRGQTLGILPVAEGGVQLTQFESTFRPIKWGTARLGKEFVEQSEEQPCLVDAEKEG